MGALDMETYNYCINNDIAVIKFEEFANKLDKGV